MISYVVYSLENKSHHGNFGTVAEAWWHGKELLEDGVIEGRFILRAHEAGHIRDLNADEWAIIEDINSRLRSFKKETIAVSPKNKPVTKYGLRVISSGAILTFYFSANEHGDTFCHLGEHGEAAWIVNKFDQAKAVLQFAPVIAGSCYHYPHHKYKAEELEVIEITMQIKKG